MSDDRYQQLFENAPLGILNADLAGRPLMVNERAATTLGYASPEEFLAEVPSMRDLWVSPEQRDRAAEIMLETGSLRGFEVELRRKDGSSVTLLVSANPVTDSDGNVTGVQVSGLDISDRIEAEKRLTELNAMKTEFVSVVAHDLRTPLTVASGYAEFLDEYWDDSPDEDRHALVGRLRRSLERLGSLVAGVLEVTRLESGNSHADRSPFDLGQLVFSTVDEIRSIEPFPTICVRFDDPLPKSFADRDEVWRVLTNLLSNAVKFSPPGEPIGVGVSRRGSFLQVSIRDRGPGIAPSDQARLFQKFSRLPAGGGPRVPGTGLGLFICNTLVEANGGSIWVDSAPAGGSTFSFTLPIAGEA